MPKLIVSIGGVVRRSNSPRIAPPLVVDLTMTWSLTTLPSAEHAVARWARWSPSRIWAFNGAPMSTADRSRVRCRGLRTASRSASTKRFWTVKRARRPEPVSFHSDSATAIGLSHPWASMRSACAEQLVGERVRVLSGLAAGRELPLTKVITIGKPGICVASITRVTWVRPTWKGNRWPGSMASPSMGPITLVDIIRWSWAEFGYPRALNRRMPDRSGHPPRRPNGHAARLPDGMPESWLGRFQQHRRRML